MRNRILLIYLQEENEFGMSFAKWLSDPQHIKVGMEPFVASWKPLGTHNAFLFTLSNFGVIGYLILFGF